jgi:hypothetical protein
MTRIVLTLLKGLYCLSIENVNNLIGNAEMHTDIEIFKTESKTLKIKLCLFDFIVNLVLTL